MRTIVEWQQRPRQHTTAAELYFHKHVRSRAAVAQGSNGESSSPGLALRQAHVLFVSLRCRAIACLAGMRHIADRAVRLAFIAGSSALALATRA